MKTRMLALLLLVSLVAGLVGCSPSATPGQVAPTAAPAAPKVATIATTFGMTSFDPVIVGYGPLYGMVLLTFETLVQHDQKANIVPVLAKSWTTSADGMTWTFKLRENVKFHDGTPFNAAAVKASWERLLNPDTAAKDVARIKSVMSKMEVIDDLTFAFTTIKPYPELLTNLTDRATAIMSPTAVAKYKPAEFGRMEPSGTGPYKFDKWVGTDRVELVPNANYWGPKPKLDRVILRVIPDGASMVAALEAGEIDMAMPMTGDDALRLVNNKKIQIVKYEAFLTHMDSMLVTVKPLDNVKVRQALNYAVDKKAISEKIHRGFAKPTETVVFPGLPYRVVQPPYDYNPAKAKQLLAEAGYPNGFEIELAFSPDFDKGKEVSEAVAAYLGDVGVKVNLKSMESAVISNYYREKTPVPGRRIFMAQKSAFGVDFNLTRMFTKASWDEDNRSRYYNETVEKLLEEARYSFDEAVRTKNYTEVQKIVWQDAPEIFLFTLTPPYGASASLKGFWVKADATPMMGEMYKE